jgi:DNA-binding GntR family transcriptional regulator
MNMMVSKERLSNQVYSILKEMIANHRFTPGARINIEQLTKELGTSRTPVWEAVHRLIQEGLLTNIPNRGVFMVELTPGIAMELYTVREALEGLAARLAVQNIDDKVVKKMKKCLDEQYKVVRKKDLLGYSRLDFDFHAMVYEACGNSILQEMLETIKGKMRPIAMHIDLVLPQLYEEHIQILEALKERDAQKAEQVFHTHNRHIIEQIKASADGNTWKNSLGRKEGRIDREKGHGTARKTVKRQSP